MANRMVFIAENDCVKEVLVNFEYHSGFAISQKQKSVRSLHEEILSKYSRKILEISSKSLNSLGVSLSAFNLKINVGNNFISVENIFQASKVFENGGPYPDLLAVAPREAKRDARLKNSGKLVGFRFMERDFPIVPTTLFYDWVYCHALNYNTKLSIDILDYGIFTDIEFNHKKSFNCQARSAAIYVFLFQNKLLDIALKDIKVFGELVYGRIKSV